MDSIELYDLMITVTIMNKVPVVPHHKSVHKTIAAKHVFTYLSTLVQTNVFRVFLINLHKYKQHSKI